MLAQNLNQIQREAGITGLPHDVGDLISIIVYKYIFYAASIGLLLYLIFGGLQLMTSRGDPKAVEGAKGKITNAVIGFVIVFIAYWVVKLFRDIFGLTDFF